MRVLVTAALIAALATGCGDGDDAVSGDLTVAYNGPSTATDGAILLNVQGPVKAVKAANASYRVETSALGGSSTRIVITGSLSRGDILKLTVDDVNAVASYSAVIEQVADRRTFALGNATTYTATIRKTTP